MVLLDVLVEGEEFFFGGGVVGGEETEVEVVLVDGDAQHQAYAAHSNYYPHHASLSYKRTHTITPSTAINCHQLPSTAINCHHKTILSYYSFLPAL